MSNKYTFKNVRFALRHFGDSKIVVVDDGYMCNVYAVRGTPMFWLCRNTGGWYHGNVTVSGMRNKYVSDIESVEG